MAKMISSFIFHEKQHRKRPGVVAKSKSSKIKTSKHYKKTYKGQGRV